MQATLTDFHKYNLGVGQYGDHKPEWNLEAYGYYLRDKIKNQHWFGTKEENEFSHWGPNAHKWNGKFGDDIPVNGQKEKRVDFKAWVRKNHPEILKEFKEVVNG